MIPILHPADEIALIRAEIRELEQREAALREILMQPGASRRGGIAQVEIKTTRRRLFLRDLLPQSILSDPAMWAEQVVRALVVQPLAGQVIASAAADRRSARPLRG